MIRRTTCPPRPAALIACTLLAVVPICAFAGRTWWDGTRDDNPAPPGKLLSDNGGYWGPCVLTGVDYKYAEEPTNPADIIKSQKDSFGRRLLDGAVTGDWYVPVGVNGKPLVVTFDFKRPCDFTELDISTRSKRVGVEIACAEEEDGDFRVAFARGSDDSPEQQFHRFPLPQGTTGRFLRLSVDGGGISWLEEVFVWGDAEVTAELPEYLNPVAPQPVAAEIAFSSIPGIDKTTFSDAQYWDWQREIGDAAQAPAVWSRPPTWDSISDRPILPGRDQLAGEVALMMARNETECAALALTNTSCEKPATLEVTLTPFTAEGADSASTTVAGTLRIAGAIPSRHYGVNLGPLFEADNLLSPGMMQRYLTNGAGIADFPKVTLSPGGSAVLWLSVRSDDAAPGEYRAEVRVEGGAAVTVRAKVLDVTLPRPPVWLHTWSDCTDSSPFTEDGRQEREVDYKQSLGATVWHGFPEPGTLAALARERGRTIHYVYGLPGKYVHDGYASRLKPEDITADDRKAITDHVRALVARARQLGLSWDDWFVELWDEPGKSNSLLYGAFAQIIHRAEPRVRVYCNPCFWQGSGVLPDEEVAPVLEPWYKEQVDISVPLYLLLRDRPRCMALFDSPRAVRAFYTVSTQSAKSERAPQVQLYRRQAWDAFAKGWNGWGFYSYYGPRGNPWTDFDAASYEDRPDYLMVYPGPKGPVATRQSEAVREGYEDYCLLTLLQGRGKLAELEQIVADYEKGADPAELRLRALELAARGQ